MTILNMSRKMIVILPLGLAACGYPGPQASTGFARPGDVIDTGTRYTIRGTDRLIGLTAAPDELGQTVRLTFEDDDTATLIVGTQRYTLAFNESTLDYRTESDTTFVSLSPIRTAESGTVETSYLAVFDLENGAGDNTGYLTYGVDTNPNEVDARTGQATYTGNIQILARQFDDDNGTNTYGVGDGIIVLTASFDQDTVSGAFGISNRDSFEGGLTIPNAEFVFDETDIDWNAFEGNWRANNDSLPDGMTLTEGEYEGRFYGVDAISAGGTLTGMIEVEDEDNAIYLEGGFVLDEDQ